MSTTDVYEKFKNLDIVLASASPRRQQLLSEMGINFRIGGNIIEEEYPADLEPSDIPVFLAREKAMRYDGMMNKNTVIIAADTIVWSKNQMLGKPSDFNEAVKMLEKLSANAHQVYTGVCIRSAHNERCFHARTDVHFRRLKKDEIYYYVENFKPYDKAGAYGIQEWIGYVGVSRIEGSYYNVMGLPVMQVYQCLRDFVED